MNRKNKGKIEDEEFKEVQLGPRKQRIPVSWKKAKIGALAEYQNGYGFSSSDWTDQGLPIIRIQNLTNSSGKELNYFDGELEEKYIVEKGDLLVSWSATLGVFKWKGPKAALNQHIFKVNSSSKVDENFLYYLLVKNLDILERKIHGTTMKHITKNTFENTFVAFPPLPEQKKIAEILSTVDEAIQKTEEIIERTKELKKGLMQDLLTKGIGHEEFKKVQLGGIKFSIPREWQVKKISDVCEINPHSFQPDNYKKDTFEYIDIDVVSTNSINKTKTIRTEEAPSRAARKAHQGNILVSTVRPYLQAFAKVNNEYSGSVCSTGFAVLETKDDYRPDFVLQTVLSRYFLDQMKKRMTGTSYPAVNNTDFKSIKLFLPPPTEQKKIAETLVEIDHKINNEQSYKEKLEELKKGLMQDLLTGRVRVTSLLDENEKEVIE